MDAERHRERFVFEPGQTSRLTIRNAKQYGAPEEQELPHPFSVIAPCTLVLVFEHWRCVDVEWPPLGEA